MYHTDHTEFFKFNTSLVPEAGVEQCKPTQLERHPHRAACDRSGTGPDSDVSGTANTSRRWAQGEGHEVPVAGHPGARLPAFAVQWDVDFRFVVIF